MRIVITFIFLLPTLWSTAQTNRLFGTVTNTGGIPIDGASLYLLETGDLGFLPETEAWLRTPGTTPFQVARDPERNPLERLLAAAERVGAGPGELPAILADLRHPDAAASVMEVMGREMSSVQIGDAMKGATSRIRAHAASSFSSMGM